MTKISNDYGVVKIYHFNTSRNKFDEKNKTPNVLKRELFKENKKCYLCEKEFDKLSRLQLEHKVPVEIGGHLFDRKNIDLVCTKCHTKKTIIDKKVIHTIKSLKIIFMKGASFLDLEELEKLYFQLFKLYKESTEKYRIWYDGVNGEDYVQEFVNGNRK